MIARTLVCAQIEAQELPCEEIDKASRRIVSLFADHSSAPFSIHNIALYGHSIGTKIGEWFGPFKMALAIKYVTTRESQICIMMMV